jgi:hypothetical protein
VHAIAFEIDSPHSPELLTIATTERNEHQPRVHHLGGGRFLVSYLSEQGSADHYIQGRIVTTGAQKMRGIR